MYFKRLSTIHILIVLLTTVTGPGYSQTPYNDAESVQENDSKPSPALEPVIQNTESQSQVSGTFIQTVKGSVLDVPQIAPVDIGIERLAEGIHNERKPPVPGVSPESPAEGIVEQETSPVRVTDDASQSESAETKLSSSDLESENTNQSESVSNPQTLSNVDVESGDDTDTFPTSPADDVPLTNAAADNANYIDADDESVISDEELEFLYQSGSLKEEESGDGSVDNLPVEEGKLLQYTSPYDTESQELRILGETVKPGEAKRLRWVASENFYGGMLDTPVHVIRGNKFGLTLCLTAAIHGDELNGVEIVRRLVDGISPNELSGTIIGIPIVNLLGFTRGSRYLPDRRDLNRYFPGNPRGSAASRIANSFIEEIVVHCDRLVDLHTGSLNRTNMPQLRANLDHPDVVEFTRHFGSTAVLHSRNLRGNLRTAATNIGIPAVTLELGEPGSLQEKHIDYGVKVIETLLDKLDMIKSRRKWSEPQPVYYSSRWVRVNNGGLLTSTVKVGAKIKQGGTLGVIVNPITSKSYKIKSPYNGRVLGKSLNQFMLPGYAAFNIGIVTNEMEASLDAQTFECLGTDMAPDQITDEFDCSVDGGDEIELPYDERDEMIEDFE